MNKLSIRKALLLEDNSGNDMEKVVMGFSIKWFIILVWCIPWTVFMGIFLDFSTFYWGLMEYFYVILLVFILTSKDYFFLSITFICTGVYYLYSLNERWLIGTTLGFYKAMFWGIINILFAIFIIVCWNFKRYPSGTRHIKKVQLPWNFYWKVVYKIAVFTGILSICCGLFFGIAYLLAQPKGADKDYEVKFYSESLEKVVRAELDIADDAVIMRKDLDSIVAIKVVDSQKVIIGKEYKYEPDKWTDEDLMYNFYNIVTCEGREYDLNKPLTNIKDFRHFRKLKYLELHADNNLIIHNLDALLWLENLETLNVSTSIYKKRETNLEAINDMENLKCLVLKTKKVTNLDCISEADKLNALRFTTETTIKDISGVKKLDKLQYLSLVNGGIKDVEAIGSLKSLRYLSLYNNEIADISKLGKCGKLEFLDLRYNPYGDITELGKLTNLRYLAILDNENIKDISPLKNLTKLEYLWISESTSYNLEILSGLENLSIYTGM